MAERKTLPILPLRGTVLFPGITVPIGVGRPGTLRAVETAIKADGLLFAVAQRENQEEPTPEGLYSVGIVLYELLTGEVPFSGESPVEIAMKHLSKVPAPPSTLRPEIPHDLDLVVMRALAKRSDERYQSADEMDADLARVARGMHVSPETEETATAIIARPITTPTIATPPAPPTRRYDQDVYYDYEEPRRRRSIVSATRARSAGRSATTKRTPRSSTRGSRPRACSTARASSATSPSPGTPSPRRASWPPGAHGTRQ